jgi:hypothetical protein
MERIYRALLRLYPYDFRLWFGAEMVHAFAQSPAPLPELAGLVAGAAAEWFAKWTGDRDARARALPDWRMMRPAGISKEVWFGIARPRCSSDT